MKLNSDMRITMSRANNSALQRNLLPDLVLNQLMDWIMDGKLHMGEKLNPEELANKLGVSRMPIREALNNLEKIGLAESVPFVGTRLIKPTKEDVSEIYLIRQSLEPIAAQKACGKITADQIMELEEIHEEYKKVVRREKIHAKEVYQMNRLFHFTIYSASGLERLCFMIESLWDSLSFFKLIYGQKLIRAEESREKMIMEHESYLIALKKGDGDELFRILSANLKKRAEDIPYDFDTCLDAEE